MRTVLAATLVTALSTMAFAQTTTTEYFVVQDAKTKKCTIVDKKPTTSTEVTVVSGGVYKTRTEAETGLKSVKVCTTN